MTMTPSRLAVIPGADGARVPVLDSLRGVAILSVFFYHALPWSGLRVDGWLSRIVFLLTRPGWIGVDLFFVLSGFLITGRLLDRRSLPSRQYYAGFYRRRVLRILPLYYGSLVSVGAVLWWASATSWQFLAFSAFFMPNIALIAGFGTSGPLAVMWSLGIEEQVYLVWPFLVRSLTAQRLGWMFVLLGVSQPVLRYLTAGAGILSNALPIATWLRLDGFAWGGWLALIVRDARVTRDRLAMIAASALICSTSLAVWSAATANLSKRTLTGASLQLAAIDMFFAGVLAASLSWAWNAPITPRRSVLASFGRVSYCLYLVHLFVFWCFDRLAGVLPPIALGPAVLRAVIVLAISTAIAELSWRYVEGPALEAAPAVGKNAIARPA
jgi:peptidoglycan/LPS O-acetylase OafA/YrhL